MNVGIVSKFAFCGGKQELAEKIIPKVEVKRTTAELNERQLFADTFGYTPEQALRELGIPLPSKSPE